MLKIKKGDEIIVIAGKDKGKRGTVQQVLPKQERLFISGINMITKHVKPNPNKNIEGGIVTREASLHVSNVAIFNTLTQKADRVGTKLLEDGRKIRIFKSNNESIDVLK